MAQGEDLRVMKGGCLPSVSDDGTSHRSLRRVPAARQDWDASKTYRQLVILISFSDTEFKDNHTLEYYQKVFNEEGYNGGLGPGCVADYFRTQSNGKCNLQFDVYGPFKVSEKACPYENPTQSTKYYGASVMKEATSLFIEKYPGIDFSQYDWDNNGSVDQVIYVYAGLSGNIDSDASYGHIWPNTSTFATITTPDGLKIYNYTASAELFTENIPCGIGTICHEFSHSLGLPDIYPVPTNDKLYTVLDEWDLMDGGIITNMGWCPPNYTPLEKMLLGWLTPVELTEATSVAGLKPVTEGGEVYQIKHTDTEYLLLENRQRVGWDKGIPGKGLVVYYVNYDESVWRSNRVNNSTSDEDCRFRLIHADNMNYDQWKAYLKEMDLSTYEGANFMNSLILSTSSYPQESNTELTDTSTPAAKMRTKNANGEYLLSKPVTSIKMSSDGLISFDFMGGATGINDLRISDENGESCIYDLSGKRVYIPSPGQMYIVKKNGVTRKYVMTP